MIKMKKIMFIFILLILFCFNITVNAASGSLLVSSDKVYAGDSFKTTVSVKGVAAWNIHVSATGPVKDCVINEVDVTDDGTDTDKTFNTNCVATGGGNITIQLSGDVTSADDGNAVDISSSKVINSVAKGNDKNHSILSNPLTKTTSFVLILILLIISTIFMYKKNISHKN